MSKPLLVIDINGILGDVRKRLVHTRKRSYDAKLPSGQFFYLHPYADLFLWTLVERGYKLILWTSRTRHNAEPIEKLLFPIPFIDAFHGEDCPTVKDFKPVKDVRCLRRLYREDIAFIDDSPESIVLDDRSTTIRCKSYDAEVDNWQDLMHVLDVTA